MSTLIRYPFHPDTHFIPEMTPEEFFMLVEDIRENGLREPITLHDGMIVDGRARYRACLATGSPATFVEWNGEGSLLDFILSRNLRRRHLSSSQRAAMAVEVLPKLEKEAKRNQQLAGMIYGRGRDEAGNALEIVPILSKQRAGSLFGVNERYVKDAAYVRDNNPKVFKRLKNGELQIKQAIELVGQIEKKRKRDEEFDKAVSKVLETGYDYAAWLRGDTEEIDLERLGKTGARRVYADYKEQGWKKVKYDVWPVFPRPDNDYFGAAPFELMDQIINRYTKPGDYVVDPFGGSGTTIQVAKHSVRRYWVSDRRRRLKVPEMRVHDVVKDGPFLPPDPSQVGMVFLDPPYSRQAKEKYSKARTDFGNMKLDKFNRDLSHLINGYAERLRPGAKIVLLISPTQVHPDSKVKVPVYHDIDMIKMASERLRLVRHIISPYPTCIYDGKKVSKFEDLIISRRIVVWEVI